MTTHARLRRTCWHSGQMLSGKSLPVISTGKPMSSENDHFPKKASQRILMFCDLRDSTDIFLKFEQNIYRAAPHNDAPPYGYADFIQDVHETFYKYLYLGHEGTFAEIYGDGVLGIFPQDNTKYILENVYRLTGRTRVYNNADGIGVLRPRIDIGFGITVGEVSFVYYPLDSRQHPIGRSIHEAARIEALSKFYDARVLISERFLSFSERYIQSDPRFSYRFIDHVVLKGFRAPITLFELLLDNDPRFETKKKSVPKYAKAFARYCSREWEPAKDLFQEVHRDYGLGIGIVMAKRCEILSKTAPGPDWNGIWEMKDK